MSYGVDTPCYNCKKKDECTDEKKLRNALNDIYDEPETHQGAGMILMSCINLEQKSTTPPESKI